MKNKGQLLILCGISGSGKSTYANEIWEANPTTTIVVNRDKIRELLFGYTEETIHNYYILKEFSKLEKEVTLYENTLIREGLTKGKTVIVDATHLKREYLERFKYFNVKTRLKFFNSSIYQSVERCANRSRKVSRSVIEKQYKNYTSLLDNLFYNPIDFTPTVIEQNYKLKPCIIWDIDGTVAHMNNRSPFDWKKVGEDSFDLKLREVYQSISDDVEIIFCTGRDAACEKETVKWLEDNGFHFTEIFMRGKNDYRPDWIVKEEMWRKIAEEYHILALIDDRQQVVDRARYLGLKVMQVEYNNF